jgi:hypothetical protein
MRSGKGENGIIEGEGRHRTLTSLMSDSCFYISLFLSSIQSVIRYNLCGALILKASVVCAGFQTKMLPFGEKGGGDIQSVVKRGLKQSF